MWNLYLHDKLVTQRIFPALSLLCFEVSHWILLITSVSSLCTSAPRQPSQTCHMGSQTCCDCKDLYFGRTGLGRGEDAAGKRNPTRSPVNTLINNWQDYAKYDRSLILNKMFFIKQANQTWAAPGEEAQTTKAAQASSPAPFSVPRQWQSSAPGGWWIFLSFLQIMGKERCRRTRITKEGKRFA